MIELPGSISGHRSHIILDMDNFFFYKISPFLKPNHYKIIILDSVSGRDMKQELNVHQESHQIDSDINHLETFSLLIKFLLQTLFSSSPFAYSYV